MRRQALVLGLLVLASGCTSNGDPEPGRAPASIQVVHGLAGAKALTMEVNSCNENPEVRLTETATEVRLAVTAGTPDSEFVPACADTASVLLARPLGARAVVDETTGKELVVEKPRGIPCESVGLDQYSTPDASVPGSATPFEAAAPLVEPGQVLGGIVKHGGRTTTVQVVSPEGEPLAIISTGKREDGDWVATGLSKCMD